MLIANNKNFMGLYSLGTFYTLSFSLMHTKIELDTLLCHSAKQVS